MNLLEAFVKGGRIKKKSDYSALFKIFDCGILFNSI